MPSHMNQPDWSSVFSDASGRWGEDLWDRESFEMHAVRMTPTGCEFPQELVLSGAAGFRRRVAWDAIGREYTPSAIRGLLAVVKDRDASTELWNQTIERLLSDTESYEVTPEQEAQIGRKPARIILYKGDAPLLAYCFTTGRNLFLNQVEAARRSRVTTMDPHAMREPEGDPVDPIVSMGLADEDLATIRAVITDHVRSWSVSQLFVEDSVLVKGRTQADVARILNWSEAKVCRDRRERAESIGRELLRRGVVEREPEHDPNDTVISLLARELKRIVQSEAKGLSDS